MWRRGTRGASPVTFSSQEVERYARQIVLREVGGPGQQALKSARVLIVGVGGLGSPAALYLAAAGVGRIGLMDGDVVSLSNLQRQVLFGTDDLGASKVERGARRVLALNPEITVETLPLMFDETAVGVVDRYDLVLDGTDSFATRFAVNAACVAAGRTLVSGAVARWSGQVGVFAGRPCYRCLVPELPGEEETCAVVGVAGALVGTVGSLMALEAIKLITGAGTSLLGRLMVLDGLAAETRTLRLSADPDCPVCGDQAPARVDTSASSSCPTPLA